MKICRRCGGHEYMDDTTYCGACGKELEPIIYKDPTDIITKGKDPFSWNHVVCGGAVDQRKNSIGQTVYACRACKLRVVDA